MLTVHHGGRAEDLVDLIAGLLAEPAADPFTREVVSVPTRGVERWIQQRLARRLGVGTGEDGVTANIAFPFPGRLVRDALGTASEIDPWQLDSLTWEILVQLRLREPGTTYQRAAQVARLFDRYAAYRPGLLHAWRAGHDTGPDGAALDAMQRWQPELFRQLVAILGDDPAAHTARRLTALRADPGVSSLPDRVVVFAVSALPTTQVDVLTALGMHRDVHLLVLHPSPGWWRALDAEPVADTVPPPTPRVPVRATHPLLLTWGQVAFESRSTLSAGVAETRPSSVDDERRDPPPTTLLSRLQHDVRTGAAPGTTSPLAWSPVDDRSIQIHACHGRTRQVEVLRDAIAHLLDDAEAGLELRDVVVLCPDLESYRPLLTSVLGALSGVDESGAPRFHLSIARAGRGDAPLVEALHIALQALRGRCTASALGALATVGAVRRTFGFTDADLGRIPEWIDSANVRWGLDGDHLDDEGIPHEVEVTTWEAALDRLLLGLAMTPSAVRLGIGDRRPCDAVDLDDAPGLGRLADLVAVLRRLRPLVVGIRSAPDWLAVLETVAGTMLTADASAPWEARQLERVLRAVSDSLAAAPGAAGVSLTLSEVLVMLHAHHEGRAPSGNWGSGSITVCGLGDLRGVPHDVVCILGLDDDVLRRAITHPDDLLARWPCAGDRDPRIEQRALLLDALMSARRHLVITFAGNDVRTNQPMPPATPLAELLDVIDASSVPPPRADDTSGLLLDGSTESPGRTSAALVVTHPRQAFAEVNLLPGALGLPGPWSFDRTAKDGALARRSALGRPDTVADLRLPPRRATGQPMSLDDLVVALTNPVRSFVEGGLGLRIPRTREERSDLVATSADALLTWDLANRLLELNARDDRSPEDAGELWHRLVTADGVLPPGRFAERAAAMSRERVDALRTGLGAAGLPLRGSERVPIDLGLPSGLQLTGTVGDVHVDTVVLARPARLRPKELIDAHVRVLALRASGRDARGMIAGIVGQAFRDVPVDLDVDADAALEALDELAEMAELSRIVALPIPPYVAASWAGALDGSSNQNPWTSDLRDPTTNLVFGTLVVDEIAAHIAPGERETGRELAQRLWHHLRGGG